MILCESLPTYTKLELRLLSEEMSKKVQKREEKDSEALAISHGGSRRTYGQGQYNNRSGYSYSSQSTQQMALGSGHGSHNQSNGLYPRLHSGSINRYHSLNNNRIANRHL